jgi:methyl-accepting chemotaxis protein
MFSKLIAFILLLAGVYIIAVFAIPVTADQYGNPEFNAKIRNIKDMSLNYASGSESPTSLMNKIITTWNGIADETRQTADQIQSTLTEKTEQAKRAAESAQKAYDAVEQAKKDFQNLTNFSGATQVSISGSVR